MAPFDPTKLLEAFKEVPKLCPNRLWQAGSRYPAKLLLHLTESPPYPADALQHEDHSACNFDFCEFSSRNFTAVQQYHEPRPYEGEDQAKVEENHKAKEVCFPLRGLFDDGKLVEAV